MPDPIVSPPAGIHAGGEDELVRLDPDHPGFRDPAYRERRNEIARLAFEYRDGDPAPLVPYTDEEQEVWRRVWENLSPLHGSRAVRVWRAAAGELALDERRVPQLAEVNDRFRGVAPVEMLPVGGLISARGFLSALGRGVFLSTQYMRHHSRPLYTPEPDVVHELVGHATSFMAPEVVHLSRLFGEAAALADPADPLGVQRLERVYWYTLEFGVAREGEDVRAYGAGLLSSAGELEGFDRRATLAPFDLERMAQTPYDPTDYQKILFVAPSFERMVREVEDWLIREKGRQGKTPGQ
jgi:phenylalanine-4-hydroxylase